MVNKELKQELLDGYTDYIRYNGKKAIQQGLNKREFTLVDYLVEELAYSREEALRIKEEIKEDE
jgi:hypothetical protein